ncbi:hypothetical protein JKP88DRAFT_171361, partial [Tribonema minus]
LMQDYKPTEVLTLNIGGAKLRLKRSALTHIEDSKLAWMFSGRWDHVLPRDHLGRIFLDLDINWFRPITDFLSELSQSAAADEAYLPIMQRSDDDRLGLQACVELFGLCDSIPAQGLAGMPQHIASVARLGQESGLKIGWSAPWQLLYQASVNGAKAREFHSWCDGKPHTLCLAMDNEGNILGGFTSVPWESSGTYKRDPAAFLFFKGVESPATQRYSQTGNSPQWAVIHNSGYGPAFGGGRDFAFTFSRQPEGGMTYSSSANTYQPMPINGTSGTVSDLFVWQVPQIGGSAPFNYSSDSTPPLELRADMSSLTGPATSLSFHFGLWLKEQLDAYDSELQAIERQAKLFAAEKAFMQQLAPEDIDSRKRAWLEKVGTYVRVHSVLTSRASAPPSPLRGVHNGIVYMACWGGGQLCTMREMFKQFGRSMLANKYASDVWARNIRAAALDEDGCIVENHHHECFQKLVNVMRLRAIVRRPAFSGTVGSSKPAPMPAHLAPAMTKMLEYLMINHEQCFNALDAPV